MAPQCRAVFEPARFLGARAGQPDLAVELFTTRQPRRHDGGAESSTDNHDRVVVRPRSGSDGAVDELFDMGEPSVVAIGRIIDSATAFDWFRNRNGGSRFDFVESGHNCTFRGRRRPDGNTGYRKASWR